MPSLSPLSRWLFAVLLSTMVGGWVQAQDEQPEAKAPAKQEEPKQEEPKKDDAKKDDAKKDDAKKDGEEEALPKDFAGLNARWTKLNGQLEAVADKYRTVFSSDERKKIFEDEYKPLVIQAERLLPKLREAAIAEYKKAPGENEEAEELVLGFAADAIRRDDYDRALELGKALKEGGCEEKGLHYILGVASYCTHDFETAEKELKAAEEARVLGPRDLALLDDLETIKKDWAEEEKIRAKEAEADDLPRVKMQTAHGSIIIELFENEAPQATANFIYLVKKKYYDGLTFHRVLGNFMAQGGCPEGTGTGGPGYNIYCECQQENHRKHFRGSLSMAHAGKDTGGSQFFLTFRPTPGLDGRHTVFGRVIEGFDVLAKIQRRDPNGRGQPEPDTIQTAVVVRDRGHKYEPTKVGEDKGDEEKEGDDKGK